MINFHEHKLWQESYVALMDIHEALEEGLSAQAGGAPELITSAEEVAATIADSLTRQDRRVGRDLMTKAVGIVAMTRTHLAVAWGRGFVDDATFKKLDDQYAALSSSLQSFR